jgi:hypothetical protein
MVQKIMGAIIILINLIKPSPNGFNFTAKTGKKVPIRIPRMMAMIT